MRPSRLRKNSTVWTAQSFPGLRLLALAVWILGCVCAFGQTPIPDLIRAVKAGESSEVRRLLDSGANISATDSEGMTALMWAANQGNSECVRLLLSKGAEADAADALGWTALIHAAGAGHTDAVEALLESGAAANARAANGATALIAAAGSAETVKILLAHGADPEVRANDGTTALLAAKNFGNQAAAQLIEAAVQTDLTRRQPSSSTELPPPTVSAVPEPPVVREPLPAAGLAPGENPVEPPANSSRQHSPEEAAAISASGISRSQPSSLPFPERVTVERETTERVTPAETGQGPSSPTQASELSPPPPADLVYLQVGAFRSTRSAEQLEGRLHSLGHSSVRQKRSEMYLVLVGPFPDAYAAINYRARLQQDGFESFLSRLPDDGASPAANTAAAEVRRERPAENTPAATEPEARSVPAAIPVTRSPSRPSTQIFLQIGAFQTESNALSFAEELTDPEHKPTVQYGADGWIRVVLGPFASREAALAYRQKLTAQGRDSILRVP